MPFRRYSGATGGGETGPSGQGDVRRDMAWHCRRLAAGGLPGSPGGDAVPTAEGLPGSPGGDAGVHRREQKGDKTPNGFLSPS